MTVGRNDPCPCGSGKKYKKCCLSEGGETLPEVESRYRRLARSYETLEERLGEHAYRVFGPDGPVLALDEFLGWPEGDEPVEADFLDRQGALFWPWFLFNWEYEANENEFELEGPPEKTVAELYGEDQGENLDLTEEQLILAANRKPCSFWEVMAIVPGKSIDFRDIMTGERITAWERTGSNTVEPGDIVFGRVAPVDGIGMIIGIGATILPPAQNAYLMELRQKLLGENRRLTDEDLLDWDVTIRRFYFDMEQLLLHPPVPPDIDGEDPEVRDEL
ncbi:MAG: SEC-C metal-binding domain-containing protein [Pseudomonadota bacterium]